MRILTIAEVAARLGVSRETVRRRLKAKEMRYINIAAAGGTREIARIPEDALDAYMKSRECRKKWAPKIDAGPDLLVEAGGRW